MKTKIGTPRSIAGLFQELITQIQLEYEYRDSKKAQVESTRRQLNFTKEEAVIRCLLVDGFLKNEQAIGYSRSNHTWNLVKYHNHWYHIDCAKACLMGGLYELDGDDDSSTLDREERYTIDEERNHMRFYFFSKPEELMITHYPEESCYSLLDSYHFDFQEFMDSAIIYPKFVIDNLQFQTKVKLNDTIDDIYIIKLHAGRHNLNFQLKLEKYLSEIILL